MSPGLPDATGLGPVALAAVGPAAVLLAAPAWCADYPTEEEALASFFPGATSVERELALVDDPGTLALRRDRTPRALFRHVARKDGEVLGYAVVEDVMGKARPITYMLAVAADGTVLGIEVLVYRESHGHEIAREAFRRQFVGKDATARLRLDKDIRNISGATISCRSITNGVADLLDLLGRLPAAESRVAEPEPESTPATASGGEDGSGDGSGSDEAPGALVRTRVLMDAPLTLALPAGDLPRIELLAAADAAFAEVARLEGLWSAFRPDSDVARLAAAAGGAALPVAPETRALVADAVALAERTDGAYDPAAGALTRLLKQAGEEPAAPALAAARAQSGWRLVELPPPTDGGPPTLRLIRRGARLDLGGSAKGAALDRAAALLRARGVTAGTLNFGGQVLVLGDAPALVTDRGVFGELAVPAGSLATSGDAERAVPDAAGGRRSHLVDPRTGAPVPVHGAVQVHAATALEADALATALYVLGPEAAWELCLAQDLAARFELDPAGATPPAEAHDPVAPARLRATPAWTRRLGPGATAAASTPSTVR